MKRNILALLTLVLASQHSVAFDSAEAISTHFAEKQAEALQSYMREHPKAEDLDAARYALLDSLLTLDKADEALAVFDSFYAELSQRSPYPIEAIMGDIAQGYIFIATKFGKKVEGLAFIEKLKEDLAKQPEGEMAIPFLDQLAAGLQKPQVGDTLDIAFTPLGSDTEFDLKDQQDKIVLVDFWATWCGPCVGELPYMKKAYEAYHDKGFEIVGISLDDDKEALESFIKREKLSWPQHFEAGGKSFSDSYGITSIPATFLIQNGKIVATDLRGDALSEKLSELLK